MSLSKNIRYLRKKKNWSQDLLAEKLGYKSYTTIQKWEMGTSEPPVKTLKVLAELFGVDMHDLANTDLESTYLKPHLSFGDAISIPILNTVVAGLPLSAYEDIIGYEEVSRKLGSPDELFALKVKGDSMLPVLQEDDVIIVKQQSDVESGDIAIVLINGDEATVKKVMKSQDGITLIAFNPAVYEPHFYPNDEIVRMPIRIAGKVVEMKRSF